METLKTNNDPLAEKIGVLLGEKDKATEVVELIRQGGFDANYQNPKGSSLLMRSVVFEDYKAAQLLLERGADPNAGDEDGWTPLMCAATINRKEASLAIIQLLLEYGADVNKQDYLGATAICFIEHNNAALVVLLMDAGADVTLRDKGGSTLLKTITDPNTIGAIHAYQNARSAAANDSSPTTKKRSRATL